jgi:hypothetical protein
VEQHLQAVLDYEAQLNRRDLGELHGPSPACDPVAAAERLITAVKIELRNRRKLAAIVPALMAESLEREFLAGVEARITAEADLLRRQIEHGHYFSGHGSRTAPDVVAAHGAAVDAQRRGAAVDYGRLFPKAGSPDYSALESFSVCAAAAVAIVRTEFGLMRLRGTMSVPNPSQAAAFDHVAINLVAIIWDVAAAADGLRIRSVRHARFALAMQWFAAALVTTDGIGPADRLELARCTQRLTRTALMPAGGREAGGGLIAEIGARAARSRPIAEAWQRCGAEAARFFA